ncbi:DUF4139 domain-containing protein [Planococcus salinarum]|uniref:DUF4139 domain-containing protein n=1 Tax=Planococcus salinarum TaxID=622695 RepID=UPI000E3C33F3|nr:DUF4139 domain-containing protein [Planococcus salinarum]TAA72037.1 DUF4139 domain-containing protein [Planococcus salinarum]
MKFQSGKATRKSLELTIYNSGFASVKEVRDIKAEKEIDQLMIGDLPAKVEADSVYIKGLPVLEQTFESGRTNKEQLLQNHIGRLITVRNMEFGEEMIIRLVAVSPDLIGEKKSTGEIVINPTGDLVLPPAEQEMLIHPTISCRIEPGNSASGFDLFYLTAGITWEASYTAELHEGKILIVGWMNIENHAGADFENCSLKAVAGIVKRAGNNLAAVENELFRSEAMGRHTEEYGFSDAAVYKIGNPVSIANGQTKQIQFLQPQPIAFQRIYRIEDSGGNAAVYLQFGDAVEDALNIPLPKGIMKLYERSPDGNMEFIGEARIGHTPAKEKLFVKIGEAYNLTNKARERSRKKGDGHEYVTFEYQIKNSKPENVGVLVEHIVGDPFWEMESSSHDYEVMDSHTLEFHVRIGAGKTVELEFTYKAESDPKIRFL